MRVLDGHREKRKICYSSCQREKEELQFQGGTVTEINGIKWRILWHGDRKISTSASGHKKWLRKILIGSRLIFYLSFHMGVQKR